MRIAVVSMMFLAIVLPAGCFLPPAVVPKALPLETRSDGAIRLTTPPGSASDQNPAFSPDGTRLVFTRFASGYNEGPAGLFLLNLDNAQITRLTPEEDQDNVNLPGSAWNAVNDRIVFASDRQDADDLWRIAPDASDFSRITAHVGLPWYIEPSWSPDGRCIVFEGSQPGASEDGLIGHIWKVRSDGGGLVQLTSDPAYDDRQPNWSPAGERILFQRRALPDGPWDIYTMAPDGSDVRNVTTTPVDETDASWSPDGACIVYSSDGGELPVPNLFVIAAGGGAPRRVTFSPASEDGAPSWSPDGDWIAFESHETSSGTSPTALWLIAAPAGGCQGPFIVSLPAVPRGAPPLALAAGDDFLYQLQNLDLAAIGETAYNLVIRLFCRY